MYPTKKMQQFSFSDPLIGLFESALYVSGDKLPHLQEQFLLYIKLWYNAPTLLPTVDKVEQQYRCIVPNLYMESKMLLKMGEFVARNM